MGEQVPSKERVTQAMDWAENYGHKFGDAYVLAQEVTRLRTALRGIQSCSTCEACRGAATLALGAEPGTWMPPCPICKKADCRLTYEECDRASQPPRDGQ